MYEGIGFGLEETLLRDLHDEINACTICKSVVQRLGKPLAMERGRGGKIMVLGVEPGQAELRQERAFSGDTGKRLFGWFNDIGLSEEKARNNIYFTALVKCLSQDRNSFQEMFKNCSRFLARQFQILRPDLLITLGQQPFNRLFAQRAVLGQIVGRSFKKGQLMATLPGIINDYLDEDTIILPLPHPSGRSSWYNRHPDRLERALLTLKEAISAIGLL